VGSELLVALVGVPVAFIGFFIYAFSKSKVAPMLDNPPRMKPQKVYAFGDQVLMAAAERHGLRHDLDIAQGKVDGVRFDFKADPHAAAERTDLKFTGRARFPKPLGLDLEVQRSGLLRGDGIAISDAFDIEFSVDALHADQAQKLLAGKLGDALLYGKRKGWSPELDDRGMSMSVPGRGDVETLAEAFDWFVETAREVLSVRAGLPRPELEQRVLDAFAKEAETRGGRVDRRTAELEIPSDVGELRASMEHEKGKHFRTTLTLTFARAVPAELHLSLERDRSAVERWRKSDVQVGDADFDATFVVGGEHEAGVREALTDDAREKLLAVAKEVATFELDPVAFGTSQARAVDDPDELHAWITAMLAAAEALCPRAEKSAYR
jgi:hypothetical protein